MGNADKIFLSGFPIRKLTFVFFVLTIIMAFLYRQKVSKEIVTVFGLFSFFFLLFSAIIPYLMGVDIIDSFSETFPYLIPLLSLCIIRNFTNTQYSKLEAFIKNVLIIFAFIHIVTAVMYLINPTIAKFLYSFVTYFFNDSSNLLNEADMENSVIIPRVQLGMSVILLLGFYYALIDCLKTMTISRVLLVLYFSVAVLVTQSRALIGLLFILLPLFYLYKFILLTFRTYLTRILLIQCTLFLPSFFTIFILYFDPIEYLELSRNVGENLRLIQLDSFVTSFNENILFGYGLGNHSGVIRSVHTPWIYELNTISVLFKIGIVGFLFLFTLILYFLFILITKKKQNEDISLYALTLSILFIFIFASNTNPYLNNFVGGFFLMMIFSKIGFIEKRGGG